MRLQGGGVFGGLGRRRLILLLDQGPEDVLGEALAGERGEGLGAGIETGGFVFDEFEKEAFSKAGFGEEQNPFVGEEVLGRGSGFRRRFGGEKDARESENGKNRSHVRDIGEENLSERIFGAIRLEMMWRGVLVLVVMFVAMGAMAVGLEAMDLRLSNPSLPMGRAGYPYQQGPLLVESSGRCPVGATGMRVVDGNLPDGMSLDGAGYLRGTPREPGRYGFAVEMRTACARAVEQVVLEVGMAPMLRVSVMELQFSCERGGRPPEPQRVMVTGSQPGLAYQMSAAGAPWLEIRPRRGALPPPGAALEADAVDLFVHPEKLDSGEYHTTLLTYAWGGIAAASTQVHLSIKPAGTGWDGVRTIPMVTPPGPVTPIPIVIVPPATLQPPPPPPVAKPKPVVAHRPAAPKRPVVPVTRSRIVTVPKITLPEASKTPSKMLGAAEILKPPPAPPQKKSTEGGH